MPYSWENRLERQLVQGHSREGECPGGGAKAEVPSGGGFWLRLAPPIPRPAEVPQSCIHPNPACLKNKEK